MSGNPKLYLKSKNTENKAEHESLVKSVTHEHLQGDQIGRTGSFISIWKNKNIHIT